MHRRPTEEEPLTIGILDLAREQLPLALLVGALLVIAWLLVHKARHPYTSDDLVRARKDSISRSLSVVSGKVGEQLAPLFPEFLEQFNPKDARFLGSPIDFVVFDGLDEGDVRRVVLVEVKTGKSAMNRRERHIREAVDAGRVEFQVLRLPGEIKTEDVPEQVADAPELPVALQP